MRRQPATKGNFFRYGALFMILMMICVPTLYGQAVNAPSVLSYSQSKSYIHTLQTFPRRLRAAFGWGNESVQDLPGFLFNSPKNIQVFQFPNDLTVVCFYEFSYAGEVVFKTNTDSILSVYPWSDEVGSSGSSGYDNLYFYHTGYTFKWNPGYKYWTLTAYTLAVVNSEYQVWEFDLDVKRFGSQGWDRPLVLAEEVLDTTKAR